MIVAIAAMPAASKHPCLAAALFPDPNPWFAFLPCVPHRSEFLDVGSFSPGSSMDIRTQLSGRKADKAE